MTPFFKDHYPPLGSFFEHSELVTRVFVLDQDSKETHDAYEAARHLADRHDLRFAFSGDLDLMKKFDKKYKYLTNNQKRYGAFEAMLLVNHDENFIHRGLHMLARAHMNHEQSITEFVNR